MDNREKCIVCGEEVSVVTTLNGTDYHLSCVSKLKAQRKDEFDKKNSVTDCLECGKTIFIQYKDHPGLHSTCWRSWKGELYLPLAHVPRKPSGKSLPFCYSSRAIQLRRTKSA